MTRHEWRDRSEEGDLIFFRADHHSDVWRFSKRPKSEDRWDYFDILSLEEMEQFRDILFNKHQRKKLPLKHVEQIDDMIDKLRRESAEADEEDVCDSGEEE